MIPPPPWGSVLAEWFLPTLAVLPLFLVFRASGMPEPLRRLWSRHRWPFFLATRVAYAALILVLLRWEFPSDLWAWDANTRGMEAGLVPGKDFFNLYAPAYQYLQAIGRWITPGHEVIGTLWVFVAADALAVAFGARLAGAVLGSDGGERVGAWLLLDPLLWHQLAVRCQDESLFLGTLVLAGWLLARRETYAGVGVLALGFCATKVTYGPYAAALLLALVERGRNPLLPWALFAAVVAAVYAVYLATGAPLLSDTSMATHEVNWGVGISATDTVAKFVPSLGKTAAIALYGTFTVGVIVAVSWRCREASLAWRVVLGGAAAHAASLLSMPFCVSPYLAQGLAFALPVLAAERHPTLRRAGLAAAAVVSWFGVMYWTKSRAFSFPMKPLCIAFHVLVLVAVWRAAATAPRREESPA